ncbi:MAG: cell envelope integrity protein TolA [Candidatus Neomarinimicrobiota bacterium]
MDLKGEPESFFGQIYYQVTFNKDNRIKSVTRFGKDRQVKETYELLWSKSGARSEYKIVFHEAGNVSRIDPNLYSNQLSYVRSGWVAKFKSRSDGRPREVSFSDSIGFQYFSYNFNYTVVKGDNLFSEVVESSYFNSNDKFVGRHLLYWEKGGFLRMIQYFNSENTLYETKEFVKDKRLDEMIRVLTDKDGKELERKIIPYMPPDKYAYKFEWDGKNVIDRGLQDIGSLNLALEFYTRSENALNTAEDNLKRIKEALDLANDRARNAEKLMRKAEGKAKDADSFQKRMDDAREEAQKAIEEMYDAEREAERARLEVAAAKATLEAVRKTKEMEAFAKKEAKIARKEAKIARKEARKKARAAKRTLQDSLLGTGPKSYLNVAFGQPIFVGRMLEDHTAGLNYNFGLGRKNMFEIFGKKVDLGLEVNWFDFKSNIEDKTVQTLSYFLIANINPRIGWKWIPNTLDTSLKFGGGLISPGFGFTLGSSAIFNLLPTPLTIGVFNQFNLVSGVISEGEIMHWTTLGLIFGVNIQDKLSSIFDIDLPSIFDIF